MQRIVCTIGILSLAVSTAAANTTALPGLFRAQLSVTINLPEGRQATLESLVIRPDKPGQFPLVVLVHGTPRAEPGKFLETYRGRSPTELAGPALTFAQH